MKNIKWYASTAIQPQIGMVVRETVQDYDPHAHDQDYPTVVSVEEWGTGLRLKLSTCRYAYTDGSEFDLGEIISTGTACTPPIPVLAFLRDIDGTTGDRGETNRPGTAMVLYLDMYHDDDGLPYTVVIGDTAYGIDAGRRQPDGNLAPPTCPSWASNCNVTSWRVIDPRHE